MAGTTWVLCDHAGQPLTEITNAVERKFVAQRNLGRSGQVTLTHDDEEATWLFRALSNGVPQLRYYRESAAGSKPLRLSAYLTSVSESLTSEGEDSLVLTFKDPFGRIMGDGSGEEPGRVLLTALTFSGSAQGTIAWTLISTLNAVSDTGLSQGSVAAGTLRDRVYEQGKNVGEAIIQLSEVLGGFDFEVLPLDPLSNGGKLGAFTVYSEQGQDRDDLLWGFGPGTMANVLEVTRQITPPINRVHMTTSDGLATLQADAGSLAKYGEWTVSRSAPSDVILRATLDAQAQAALRPNWVKVLSFKPDPVLGPQPFDDFWLGDTGRFKASQGAFEETFIPRVTGVTTTEDADGEETFELETEVAA